MAKGNSLRLIAIKLDVCSLAYIFLTRIILSLCAITTHKSSPLISLSSYSAFIPVPNLYVHRDRESRPLEPDALHRDTCSGVRAIRFLGSVFRDCSFPRIGEIGYFLLPRIGFILVDKQSATLSSSWWTFVGLHCEHLPVSTVVRYFKQRTMSTSANGAAGAFGIGPSSEYNPKRLYFIFSMSTVVFAMFISNLSSDKITHVHIYATTLLCVIF